MNSTAKFKCYFNATLSKKYRTFFSFFFHFYNFFNFIVRFITISMASRGPLCAAQYVPTLPTISLVRNFADKDETKFEIIPITLSTTKSF